MKSSKHFIVATIKPKRIDVNVDNHKRHKKQWGRAMMCTHKRKNKPPLDSFLFF